MKNKSLNGFLYTLSLPEFYRIFVEKFIIKINTLFSFCLTFSQQYTNMKNFLFIYKIDFLFRLFFSERSESCQINLLDVDFWL